MQRALAELGRSLRDVRGVLLTHWHNDHTAGLDEIQKQADGPVYCHSLEAHHFDPSAAWWERALWKLLPDWGPFVLLKGLLLNKVPFGLDRPYPVANGDRIDDLFQVVETPGHTAGHLSFLYLKEKTLFAGDAIAIVNGQIRAMARFVTPDTTLALESMRKLSELDVQWHCPGHRDPLRLGSEDLLDFQRRFELQGWPLWG